MKLKALNQLVSKKIEESSVPKTDLAERIDMTLSAFNYKYQNGNLEWGEILRLGLPITKKEFAKAIDKDLRSDYVEIRERA